MLYPQPAGVKWGPGANKSVEVETVPGGLIMSEGREIQEIWLDLSLESISFFKNQPKWLLVKSVRNSRMASEVMASNSLSPNCSQNLEMRSS